MADTNTTAEKKNKLQWIENISIMIIDVFLFYLTIIRTGAITSGIHLVDDHEAVYNEQAIQSSSFLQAFGENMMRFIIPKAGRYRPFYGISLVMRAQIFGTDMNKWMLMCCIMGIASFFMLYKFARLLKSGVAESFIFASVSIFGYQIAPWYRAITQEYDGTFFMSLSLLMLAYIYTHEWKKDKNLKIFKFLYILVTLCMAWTKESFFLILPAMIMLIIFMEEKTGRSKNWIEAVKRNPFTIGALAAWFAFSMFMVVVVIGSAGAAGFGDGATLRDYINSSADQFLYPVSSLMVDAVLLFLSGVAIIFVVLVGGKRDDEKGYVWLYMTSLFIITSQLALHASSGLQERYIIPWSIGTAMFIALLALKMIKNCKPVYVIAVLFCLISVAGLVHLSKKKAQVWSLEGKSSQALIFTLKDMIEEKGPKKVYVGLGSSEFNKALATWENYMGAGECEYFSPDHTDENLDYDFVILEYDDVYDPEDDEDHCLEIAGIDPDDYEFIDTTPDELFASGDKIYEVGRYAIGVRKDKSSGD